MAKPNFTLPNKPAIKSGSILSYNYTDDFTFVPAPLTFNRDSSATRVNEKGLIEDVGYFGPELVQNGDFSEIGPELITNGDFATDSDWAKGTGWSISGGKANCDGTQTGNTNLNNSSSNGIVNNKFYKIVYTISNYVSGSIRIKAGNTGFGVYHSSNGTYTQYIKAQVSTFPYAQFNADADFIGSIDNVSVKEVGQNWTFGDDITIQDNKAFFNNSAYPQAIEQTNVATIGNKYIVKFTVSDYQSGTVKLRHPLNVDGIQANGDYVFEGEAAYTSVVIRGDGAPNNFKISNISVIEVLGDKPRIDYSDSLTEPSLLLEPQSTNLITYSEDFSQSYWIKDNVLIESGYTAPDGGNNAYKVTENGGNAHLIVLGSTVSSLNRHKSIWARTVSGTGTVQLLNHNSDTSNIFTLTTQWQRFDIAHGGLFDHFYAVDFRGASTTLSEVIIWGAQLEELSYATSYIPTAGSTTTRLGETANNAGDVNVFNSEEGVLYAEIAALANDGTNRQISISNGTTTERVYFGFRANTNEFILSSKDSSYVIATVNNVTDYNKYAFQYKLGNFKAFVNGVSYSLTANGGSLPTSLDRLSFDNASGTQNFYGKVRNLKVFNKALTDRELEILTIQ
jgi:hypothetical protein